MTVSKEVALKRFTKLCKTSDISTVLVELNKLAPVLGVKTFQTKPSDPTELNQRVLAQVPEVKQLYKQARQNQTGRRFGRNVRKKSRYKEKLNKKKKKN